MNPFFWIFVAADTVGFVLLLWAMIEAPVGYEDDQGFKTGNEPGLVPVRQAADTAGRRGAARDELAA